MESYATHGLDGVPGNRHIYIGGTLPASYTHARNKMAVTSHLDSRALFKNRRVSALVFDSETT